jgi:hypothetical protein
MTVQTSGDGADEEWWGNAVVSGGGDGDIYWLRLGRITTTGHSLGRDVKILVETMLHDTGSQQR